MVGGGFAVGWSPCVGPVLGFILTLAATSGDAVTGTYLLAFYSAGLGIPFLLAGLAVGDAAKAVRKMQRFMPAVEVASAAMLIALGAPAPRRHRHEPERVLRPRHRGDQRGALAVLAATRTKVEASPVVDRQFSEPRLAALYDPQFGREARDDYRFYLPLIMEAGAVLDVGCGTGALLHWARESGHSGRLTGLDPAAGMLDIARTRADIEWVHGDLGSVAWDREFDLAVMTGHAFQVLVEDEQIRASLASVYSALTPGGLFAFETRNPAARAWGEMDAGARRGVR